MQRLTIFLGLRGKALDGLKVLGMVGLKITVLSEVLLERPDTSEELLFRWFGGGYVHGQCMEQRW